VPTNQECIFQAGLIIQLVITDLRGSIELGVPMWDFELEETCERLEQASEIIRSANGGVG
jgi:hypothetical protein